MRWWALLCVSWWLAAPAWAATPTSLDFQWDAPTTSADGSPLGDLSGYRFYLDTPCPSAQHATVAAASPVPSPGTVVGLTVNGLTPSTTYTARVTAVDLSGNESPCSAPASGTTLAAGQPLPATDLAFVYRGGPALEAWPTLLTFTWRTGATLPGAQHVTVAGGAGAWTTRDCCVTVTYAATATGFDVAPSAAAAGLPVGAHVGTILVERGTEIVTITVRLVVTP